MNMDISINKAYVIKFMNLLIDCVKQGSAYAKTFILNLYKFYYKQEYKQLKRFRILHPGEVEDLAADGWGAETFVDGMLGFDESDEEYFSLPPFPKVPGVITKKNIGVLRENKIPFGYIHRVNLEMVVAQIYHELTAE